MPDGPPPRPRPRACRRRRPRLAPGRLVFPIQFTHAKLGEVYLPARTTVLGRYGRHTLKLLEPEQWRGVRVPRVLWRLEKPDPEILKTMLAR